MSPEPEIPVLHSQVCSRDAESCRGGGLPGCAGFLGERPGGSLSAAAARLLPLAGAVARRWENLALGAGLEAARHPEAASGEVKRLLDALSSRNDAALSALLFDWGERSRNLGVPLVAAISGSQLLVEACAGALETAGAARPEVLEARVALHRLSHARLSVQLCAYASGGALAELARAAVPAESGARPATGPVRERCHGLVGSSPPMQQLYERVETAARTRETVLTTGESGTGKELVARAIHAASGDPPDRFIAVNCAALPRDLVESELFGHRRGSFSGAVADQVGMIRAASGGTILLDEISELSPDAQAKLLRVIQERAVRPVGEVREIAVDVRVVAATNRRLADALSEGRLRRDLYYRLQRLVIDVPPLRERREDIPALARCFAERWRAAYSEMTLKRFSRAALERLAAHDWPGNVRELENAVFAACTRTGAALVRESDLPPLGIDIAADDRRSEPAPGSLREAERSAIREALERAAGNKALASRLLGISRKQLYAKLRLYRLGC